MFFLLARWPTTNVPGAITIFSYTTSTTSLDTAVQFVVILRCIVVLASVPPVLGEHHDEIVNNLLNTLNYLYLFISIFMVNFK